MKLSKRLLAVLLTVAMLVGMVAVAANASITDYTDYDPVDNPYTIKYAIRVYSVDKENGNAETEIVKGTDGKYHVEPGQLIRIESCFQTNYFVSTMQWSNVYSDAFFQPTMNATNNFTTYDYRGISTTGLIAKIYEMAALSEDADGSAEAPFRYVDGYEFGTGFAGGNQVAQVKGVLPASWKNASGTTMENYVLPEYRQYNLYRFGFSTNSQHGDNYPAAGTSMILTEMQPVWSYYLTVKSDLTDDTEGRLFVAAADIKSSAYTTGYSSASRRLLTEVVDESTRFVYNSSNTKSTQYQDTYGDDTTKYDRVIDVSDADLTFVVGAQGGEEPPVQEVNKDALAAAIATTPAVLQANATSASWGAYTAALAAAETVYANADATQDDVDDAKEALLAAIEGVTALGTCNYNALNSILSEYNGYNEADYTTASWAVVAEAYNAATAIEPNLVNDELGVNQAAILAAADALANALGDLVDRGDKSALQTAVTNAPAVAAADVTAASYNALQAALSAANTVLNNIDATQADINTALNNLNAAINGLSYLGDCDYEELNAAKASYERLNRDNYTPDSVRDSCVDEAYIAATEIAAGLVNDEAGANQKSIDDAAAALNAAIDALVEKADKTNLEAAIATIPAYADDEATSASWTAYEEALEDAEAVFADENATQEEVEEATDALNEAIAGITFLGYCDYDDLNTAIAAYEALDIINDYTPDSVEDSEVETFYEEAKRLADDDKLINDEYGVNQGMINDAAEYLSGAIGELVRRADFTGLNAKIAAAQAYTADGYTPASWTAADLADVIEAAQAVAANANATQAAVNAQIDLIDAAIAKLVATADKGDLLAKINEAIALALDEENYTPTSWTDAALADAINDAQDVYEYADATNTDVADQITALNAAIAKLVAKANKANLAAAIETTPAVAPADATTESWAAYEEAFAAAQTVAANANATQNEVDEAETALRAAIAGVTALAGCDYSELDAAIAEYDALTLDDYTPASRTDSGVETAYAAATAISRTLLADELGEHQAIIDAAAADLDEAIDALVLKANKDALAEAIETAPAYEEDEATSASWRNYTLALEWANGVYAEDNATQTAVDNAEEMLREAIALVTFLGYCDYDELNDAVEAYEALDLDNYTPDSLTASNVETFYDEAKGLANGDKLINDEAGTNQAAINAAAAALAEAIDALVPKADKTALAEAIAAAPSIMEDNATDDSWNAYAEALDAAQAVNAYDNASQDDVEEAAEALVNANAELALRDLCDYSALETAIANEPALEQAAYTPASWSAYAAALAEAQAIPAGLVDNKAGTNQEAIDAAADALAAAFLGLAENTSSIVAVEADCSEYYRRGTLPYAIKVKGAPSKIQIISPDGGTMTFDRYNSNISVESFAADGSPVDYDEVAPDYEIWSLDLVLGAGEYALKAKYGKNWDVEPYTFTIEYATYIPQTTFVAKIVGSDDEPSNTLAFADAKRGSAVFTVVTPNDIIKVQLLCEGGQTSTYTTTKAVADDNGNLVWTITRGVTLGDGASITLKVKSDASGWQIADCEPIAVSFAAE